MIYSDAAFLHHVQQVIEILGTLAFAISGIRQAAYKHYDWFGGFVCGFAVAIGGGTLRDVMLGVIPFWMTLGLALFTIAGIQKTLQCDHPFWVAIIMGCITGSAGGIMRDLFLNRPPVIFSKEIYAMASIAGGLLYWALYMFEINIALTVIASFLLVVTIRFVAVRYHISLPVLRWDK